METFKAILYWALYVPRFFWKLTENQRWDIEHWYWETRLELQCRYGMLEYWVQWLLLLFCVLVGLGALLYVITGIR